MRVHELERKVEQLRRELEAVRKRLNAPSPAPAPPAAAADKCPDCAKAKDGKCEKCAKPGAADKCPDCAKAKDGKCEKCAKPAPARPAAPKAAAAPAKPQAAAQPKRTPDDLREQFAKLSDEKKAQFRQFIAGQVKDNPNMSREDRERMIRAATAKFMAEPQAADKAEKSIKEPAGQERSG